MSNINDSVTFKDLRDCFKKIYFSRDGQTKDDGGAERVNTLFQMAREYRDLYCHENELLNQKKVFFWSVQAMLCSAYCYIWLREESVPALTLFLFFLLQIFLCISGGLLAIRFLQKLNHVEQARRFLRFRYQIFLELYCSCLPSEKVNDEDNENDKMLPWLALSPSISPLFPPIIGLARMYDNLIVSPTTEAAIDKEKVELNCQTSCSEILLQIINAENKEKPLDKRDNSWFFKKCSMSGLAKYFPLDDIQSLYGSFLFIWWIAMIVVAVVGFCNNFMGCPTSDRLIVGRILGWALIFFLGFVVGKFSERVTKENC